MTVAAFYNGILSQDTAFWRTSKLGLDGVNHQVPEKLLHTETFFVGIQENELAIDKFDHRQKQIACHSRDKPEHANRRALRIIPGATQEVARQSGDLSGEITKEEVTDIPINGLNPISRALSLPGVTQPASRDDFTNGVGFSVNGTRPRANNFLIDGQDNNDLSITGQAFQPQNLEAIGVCPRSNSV